MATGAFFIRMTTGAFFVRTTGAFFAFFIGTPTTTLVARQETSNTSPSTFN